MALGLRQRHEQIPHSLRHTIGPAPASRPAAVLPSRRHFHSTNWLQSHSTLVSNAVVRVASSIHTPSAPTIKSGKVPPEHSLWFSPPVGSASRLHERSAQIHQRRTFSNWSQGGSAFGSARGCWERHYHQSVRAM